MLILFVLISQYKSNSIILVIKTLAINFYQLHITVAITSKDHIVQMGQQSSLPKPTGQTARSYLSVRIQQSYNRRIQHEGLLKLRPVPFKNCIEIQTEQRTLFLENIQITLKDLLETRLYTNKLFPKEDVARLIENITYTLAFLQQNGIPYKDVSAQNIFYDDGVFKLLPNQLIPQSRYQKFLNSRLRKTSYSTDSPLSQAQQFVTLSPQMIIAYRCKELQIRDLQIIDKSNVFYLGMLLLQVTTLLPSHQCYDIQSNDILDQVITQRIELIKEYYSVEIASIVANFLDYDYVERMGLKEGSIFVNRELNNRQVLMGSSKITRDKKVTKQQQVFMPQIQHYNNDQPIVCSDQPIMVDDNSDNIVTTSQLHKSSTQLFPMSKSRFQNCDIAQSRISRSPHLNEKRKNKTNKIYINGGGIQQQEQESVSIVKEDRNKIYMKQQQQQQQGKGQMMMMMTPQRSTTPLKQIQNTTINGSAQNSGIVNNNRINNVAGKVINMTAKERLAPSISSYIPKSPYQQQPNNQQDDENRFPQGNDYTQQRNMKRKNSTDYLGYRPMQGSQVIKTPKQEKLTQNNKYQDEQYEQKNYCFNQNIQKDNDFNYPPKRNNIEHRYIENDTLNEDSGSRGYFDHGKSTHTKPIANNDFKDHDTSLSRIKTEIQRSRKLIEEFKRGQNTRY